MREEAKYSAASSEAPRPVTKPVDGRARCGAKTIRGGVCTATATMPDQRCPHHTTTVSEKTKRAWRQRGLAAQQRGRQPVTFTPADYATEDGARKMLEEASDLVRQGKMPTSVANAVSKLAGTAMKLAELKLSKQLSELERRVRAMSSPR